MGGRSKADMVGAPTALEPAAWAISSTSVVKDLSGYLPGGTAGSGDTTPGPGGVFVALRANCEWYAIFGPTNASVSAGNAPVVATVGDVGSTGVNGTAGVCFGPYVASEEPQFEITRDTAFVAIICASGVSGIARVCRRQTRGL
ncbi:MAG: hypothetical protein ACRCU1_00365 [Alsobacter sp.]